MKNKIRLLIIWLILSFLCFEGSAQDSLAFKLEIQVSISRGGPAIPGALINVYDSNGNIEIGISDSLGRVEFYLLPNMSYNISVQKEAFLNAKGHETTIGETESKVFVHEYYLQYASLYSPIPALFFEKNSIVPIDSGIEVGNAMQEMDILMSFINSNEEASFTIYGLQDENEDSGLDKKRAELFYKMLFDAGVDSLKMSISLALAPDFEESTLENKARNLLKEEYIKRELWNRSAGIGEFLFIEEDSFKD